jgi:hypothetical protein
MTPVEFEGKRLERVSVKEYLRWVQVESKRHFTEEGQYLANQEAIPNKCETCSMLYCDCPSVLKPTSCGNENVTYLPRMDDRCNANYCTRCEAHHKDEAPVLEPHTGEWEYYSGRTRGFFHRRAENLQRHYERALTSSILATNAVCVWWEKLDFMPESWICHPRVLKFGLFFWRENIKRSLISGNSFFVFTMIALMWSFPRLSLLWLSLTIFMCYWYTCATIQTYKKMVRNRILELKDVVRTYTQQWQSKYAIIGLGAIGIILATMRTKYTKLNVQTGLNPENIGEVDERNDRVNPWLVVETVPLPMSEPSKTTTSDNLASSMKTNLVGVVSDKNKTTLGFYITSNFMLVPTHFLREHGDRDVSIRCYKTEPGKVGSYFKDKISKAFRVDIPLTDFTLCFVTSGGSMKDFRKFLPEGNVLKRTPAKLVTREIMGSSLQAIPMLFRGSSRVAHTQTTFMGSYYDLPIETQAGMCMSPVISDAKGSMILGFHLGGKGKLGGCGTLTVDQVNHAIGELSTVDGVVLSASCGDLIPNMGDFPTETFGKSIFKERKFI